MVVGASALKSCVYSFNKCLLGAYFMLDARPGKGDKMTSEMNKVPVLKELVTGGENTVIT